MALHNEEINGGHIAIQYYDQVNTTWTQLAFGTSHNLEFTVDTREITNKDTCGLKKKKATKYTWSGGAEGMNSYQAKGFVELVKVAKTRDTIFITSAPKGAPCTTDDDDFGGTVGDRDTYEIAIGECILTSVTADYPDEDNSTFSISFEGAGDLEFMEYSALPADPYA